MQVDIITNFNNMECHKIKNDVVEITFMWYFEIIYAGRYYHKF